MVVQDEPPAEAAEDTAEDLLGLSLGSPEGAELEAQIVEVSLNSVVDLTSPKTMKLLGSVLEREVVVLIDSGATHNFITADLVSALQLPVSQTEQYGVQMGTGQVV